MSASDPRVRVPGATFGGHIPNTSLHFSALHGQKSGCKTASVPIQIPIVPNLCADGDPPEIGLRVADLSTTAGIHFRD